MKTKLKPRPLTGEWRHSNGVLCCGTLRIATADFDTNPSDEFKNQVFDFICDAMNRRTAAPIDNHVRDATKMVPDKPGKWYRLVETNVFVDDFGHLAYRDVTGRAIWLNNSKWGGACEPKEDAR